MDKGGWVYILASRYRGTLYIGVTANLAQRIWQHRNGMGSDHVRKYDVFRLVYTEPHTIIQEAIQREKQLKRWKRDWKIRLVEEQNPDWVDLFDLLNA
ncbi:GIY-YIG nuclease family protein [Rhizorhapis sp. SPR117]|uniref:GIY-YIG nuclease family protein n=1 Tax=Rhizorhapis sp. SPR117 TaxID=2912611 RepID=UPI001F36C11C|nr:GIY-YIG nuclease family protein [Rhizorhapis sp. SPR117]